MDDLDILSQQALLDSRQYEHFNGGILRGDRMREDESLALLGILGGQQDAYGMSVPERLPPGQQEFNRLQTGSPFSQTQQRYLNTRDAVQGAHRRNQDASFETSRLQQPPMRATGMRPRDPTEGTDLNPFPRGEAPMPQKPTNPKHQQAIAFAKALGFGQQISSNPANVELAYKAMDMMLRRVPLPILLNPKRKQQTAMEFQLLLEKLSQPTIASTGRPPIQPT